MLEPTEKILHSPIETLKSSESPLQSLEKLFHSLAEVLHDPREIRLETSDSDQPLEMFELLFLEDMHSRMSDSDSSSYLLELCTIFRYPYPPSKDAQAFFQESEGWMRKAKLSDAPHLLNMIFQLRVEFANTMIDQEIEKVGNSESQKYSEITEENPAVLAMHEAYVTKFSVPRWEEAQRRGLISDEALETYKTCAKKAHDPNDSAQARSLQHLQASSLFSSLLTASLKNGTTTTLIKTIGSDVYSRQNSPIFSPLLGVLTRKAHDRRIESLITELATSPIYASTLPQIKRYLEIKISELKKNGIDGIEDGREKELIDTLYHDTGAQIASKYPLDELRVIQTLPDLMLSPELKNEADLIEKDLRRRTLDLALSLPNGSTSVLEDDGTVRYQIISNMYNLRGIPDHDSFVLLSIFALSGVKNTHRLNDVFHELLLVDAETVFTPDRVSQFPFLTTLKEALAENDYQKKRSLLAQFYAQVVRNRKIDQRICQRALDLAPTETHIDLATRQQVFDPSSANQILHAVGIVNQQKAEHIDRELERDYDYRLKSLLRRLRTSGYQVDKNIEASLVAFTELAPLIVELDRQRATLEQQGQNSLDVQKNIAYLVSGEFIDSLQQLNPDSIPQFIALLQKNPLIRDKKIVSCLVLNEDTYLTPQGEHAITQILDSSSTAPAHVSEWLMSEYPRTKLSLEVFLAIPTLLPQGGLQYFEYNQAANALSGFLVSFNQPSQIAFFQQHLALVLELKRPLLSHKDYPEIIELIMKESFTLGGTGNLQFWRKLLSLNEEDIPHVARLYTELVNRQKLAITSLSTFFDALASFSDWHSFAEYESMIMVLNQGEGEVSFSQTMPQGLRNALLIDFCEYKSLQHQNKIRLLKKMCQDNGYQPEQIEQIAQALRWVQEDSLRIETTLQDVQTQYEQLKTIFTESFTHTFSSEEAIFQNKDSISKLIKRLESICQDFQIPYRKALVKGALVPLPLEFISKYRKTLKINPSARFMVELSIYIVDYVTKHTTAPTVSELIYGQLYAVQDKVNGRRRNQYKNVEQLFSAMEQNIEASVKTWETALAYQALSPDRPLFIIANERTGPADLAAEFLPEDWAKERSIAQNPSHDEFFRWFTSHLNFIDELYERHLKGENVTTQIPMLVQSMLQVDTHNVIPIYRIKIPSSLSDAKIEEPEGLEKVITFLKFVSILGGKTLFMDESTRSAPRSIECLYNAAVRRSDTLGGVTIELFGKINQATGQSGTSLVSKFSQNAPIDLAMIDPWESETKPINDDSEDFVPEISGSGVVEIIRPSLASISPWGIYTLQDMWKQMIAHKVVGKIKE